MKLQFTNEYYPQFDQISRILQTLVSNEAESNKTRQDVIKSLGIPGRQCESFISMMTGFGLIVPRTLKPTFLGKIISQFDPYFEKLETLWIIHYIVASEPEYVIWHRIVNNVIPLANEDSFSAQQIAQQYFSDMAIHYSNYTFTSKIPGEIRAVFNAYTRSSFSRLGLLTEDGKNNFKKAQPVDIPPLAFLYCLAHFREKHYAGSSALDIETICRAENSPGKVLLLSEYQVRSQLEDLHNAGIVRLEQLANLDQVRFTDSLTTEYVLQKIYGGQDAN